jgi:F-type H+-transporting ATPase subunit delta
MAETAVARRYVRALFDASLNAKAVDQVESDLKAVDQIMRAVPRLARVLHAPTIAGSRKSALLDTAFSGRVGALTLRFLKLLVDRRREDALGELYNEFRALADEHRGIVQVEVTSAVPLTDAEREALAASLSQRTGKKVQLTVAVDESLLGGLMLRMGDTIVDGSVRTRLARLRERLLGQRL